MGGIEIRDYDKHKLDKRRVNLTVRFTKLQAAALSRIYFLEEDRTHSYSSTIREGTMLLLKQKYGIDIPPELDAVIE